MCGIPDVDVRALPLNDLIVLTLQGLSLTDANLIFLSEHIPHMTNLNKLVINEKQVPKDGLLKILQQLSHSNVTTLDITGTGVCSSLKDSPHDYYSAIKALICPPSGRLEELHFGDEGGDDDTLAGLVSGPSSLKTLVLYSPNLSAHVPYLVNNTCLTTLRIKTAETVDNIRHIVTIVEHNKTLQHLKFCSSGVLDIDSLRTLVGALSSNDTLKSIIVGISSIGGGLASDYMNTHHRDSTLLDHRVTWLNT